MPQLNPTWFVSQLFWLCICFFALYFVVSKSLAPRIAEIIKARQDKIDGYINAAEGFKKKAEASLSTYEKSLADAKEKADKQISTQKIELEKFIDEKNQELSQKISSELKKTEMAVSKIKEEALQEVDKIAATISSDIIKKMEV